MVDQVDSADVLALIEQELERAQEEGLDPQHELLVAVGRARADHAGDPDGEAVAALATLVAYGSVSSQQDVRHTLAELASIVGGLGKIEDIRYVSTDRIRNREVSLLSHLPGEGVGYRLTHEEWDELEVFIAAGFGGRDPGPNNEPGPRGPSP